MKSVAMPKPQKRKAEDAVSSQNSSKRVNDKKCFNDPIHGIIELHPLLVAVIDTPQFQRLRKIKQLGGNYLVYPGASHNRFEHCIGTCHLAGELVRHLKATQEKDKSTPDESKITDTDVLCVELAGLCHDLGHGPYSHMFDNSFLPQTRRNEDLTHEKLTRRLIDKIFENEKLRAMAKKEFDINEEEKEEEEKKLNSLLEFVKNMIDPKKKLIRKSLESKSADKWPYEEQEHKKFLFEIVSNPINGVDVDKWDYFARDCHHLGLQNSFQLQRFMKCMKVLPCEREDPNEKKELHLCARNKEILNLYEMFHTRATLYKRAYLHKVSTAVEMMICDAMVLANNHITFKKDGIEIKISDSVDDMDIYTQLNDSIFDKIVYSTDNSEEMVKARKILERLEKRNLYKFIGSQLLPSDYDKKKVKVQEQRFKELVEKKSKSTTKCPDDYDIKVKEFDYGMKKEDPVKKYWFYNKDADVATRQVEKKTEEFSYMLPSKFQDISFEVYCKDNDEQKKAILEDCFKEWEKEFIGDKTAEEENQK